MLSALRLIGGAAMAVIAALTLAPAPSRFFWFVAIAATEWGYWLVLPALLPLLPGWRRSLAGRLGGLLGVTAAALLVTPVIRALPVRDSLAGPLTQAFGEPHPSAPFADAPRPGPLILPELVLGVRSSPVRYEERVYARVDGQELKLDLYHPSYLHESIPAVIVIHGGGWRGGDSGELVALNGYLAARNYVVAAVNYRLAPRWRFPAARDDVLAAIEYLKANAAMLGLDPDRIALVGRSAGGQLALLVAYTSQDPAIRGVAAYYAPGDLRWGYDHPSNPRVLDSKGVLESYLGGNPASAGTAYDAASPVRFVGPASPPTLLVHGLRDELVSHYHSEQLAARLTQAGVRHYFLRLPWATHGCDRSFSGPCGQLSTYAVERFLGAVMKPAERDAKPAPRLRRASAKASK